MTDLLASTEQLNDPESAAAGSESASARLAALRDPGRLAALRESGLLDSEIEEEFDRLTRLAAKLLSAPATFFSLVDADRDFYKSCFGFEEPLASDRQIEGTTFCHFALVSDGALVIPDTRADPIYRQVPTVKSMGVSAYIGIPIRAPSGAVLGSFCAIDFHPRDWSALEVDVMRELAKSAEREVALRDWMRRQKELVEEERRGRRELEEVMRSRERLIRGFTHDVKNPLGAADGFLALMEGGITGELSEPQKVAVARIRRILGDAFGLINSLLEIARAETEELEIRREAADLSEIVQRVADEYRAQAEAKGLEVHYEVRHDLPLLHSDAARIRQILGNLFSNALKYTPSGRITVTVQLEAESGRPRWAAVSVSDTGPGIPEEQRHLLFREFTRLDPEAGAGVGLGLAISQRIARALGGEISMSEAPGGGSVFTLRLPLG